MLVFPQMTTGSVALYPLARKTSRRTVVNRMLDGSSVVYADPDWAEKRWELECVGLSEVEWAAVEGLFASVNGRLETFTFLERNVQREVAIAWKNSLSTVPRPGHAPVWVHVAPSSSLTCIPVPVPQCECRVCCCGCCRCRTCPV